MSLFTRLADYLFRASSVAPLDARAYVVGPSVVELSDVAWGHDDTDFSDPSYLDYVASSNNVYACVTKRATAMASLPLVLYRGTDKATRKANTGGPLRNLLDSVNPWMTFDHLLHVTEQHLCLMGEAFWFLERGTSGTRPPVEIWPVRPDFVKVVPDARDFIRGFVLDTGRGNPISYRPDEVIWFPLPNPKDPYAGLAPLAGARLAADVASAAMKSNKAIFSNGVQLGGVISPPDSGGTITEAQATALQDLFKKGFKGASNAHRLAILDYAVKFQQWTMTPKDAEFIGAMNMSLEEIARAFGIIPELLGAGNRTFQNAPEARYAFWADTITAEARFVARILTERLLPMFPGEADVAEFDFSDVDALKENEDAIEARWKARAADGRVTINEWRADQGLKPVAWGDDWWKPLSLEPIGGPMATQAEAAAAEMAQQIAGNAPQDAQDGQGGAQGGQQAPRSRGRRTVAYGSPEHVAHHNRVLRRAGPWERKVAETTAALMRRQREEIVANLHEQDARLFYASATKPFVSGRLAAKDLLETIFALPKWVRQFRTGIRPVVESIVEDAGQAALDDMGLGTSFDLLDPNVVLAMERQAQRFATEVNQTTWDQLRASLSEGLQAGEGTDALAARVDGVMGSRIASSAEVIARTEVTTAANTGTLESWRQSGVVRGKVWLAALDERTRDTHVEAHGQEVGIDEDFTVGGATGPGPGMMGAAEEDINCRCSMTAVLDTAPPPERTVRQNGHAIGDLMTLARALGVEG